MRLSNTTSYPHSKDTHSINNATTTKHKIEILAFLILCVTGAVAISRIFLIHNSLRLDEAQSLWQTSHSVRGTLKVIAQDVHVPLYHLILHFWQLFVGQGVESARSLSLLFFILTIPVVYLVSRKLVSISWALFAVFLFSFSPFMNWYANEARMYTMLGFIATLSQYFFIQLIQSRGKRGWLGYSLSAMIGVYSHYFFIFNLVSQGMFFLFTRKQFEKGTLKRFILLAGIILLELAPWLLYFHSLGSASNTSPNLSRPSTVDFFNVYSQFAFGFQNNHINTVLVSAWPLLVIVALLGVKHRQRISLTTGYVIVAALVPILFAYVLSYTVSPFFLSRYMIASLTPLTILIVWLISNYQRLLKAVVSTLLIILLVGVSLQQYQSNSTPVKENYRVAAEFLNQKATAQDIIVLSAPFTVYPLEYYYTAPAKLVTLPLWNRSIPGAIPPFQIAKLPDQVNEIKVNHQYVYLLLSYNQGYEEQIFQYYQHHFEKVDSRQFSPDLRLYVYRVGYSSNKSINEL